MNWSLFAGLADQIDQPFQQAVNGVADNLLAAVSGPFAAAAVIYVALLGWQIIAGRAVEPLRDSWFKLMKVAVVAFILGAGAYHQYVSNLFLNGIPADITGAITGSTGSVTAASFDHVWNKAFGAGLAIWKNLSWDDFGLQMLIGIYWFVSSLACGVAFLFWLISHILIGLLVAVGPLVLPMFLFAATRSMFDRWIGALMGMVFLQVFIVILLVVLIAAENSILARLSAQGGGNPMAQIQVILGAVILFCIACFLLKELPGVATALAGGIHFHAHALSRATFGRLAQASMGAAGAGGRMMIAAPAHARAALAAPPRTPPGPSLSTPASARVP